MKKNHLITILLLFASLQSSHGFVENRHQWWEIRLQKLSAEKVRVFKAKNIDRQVVTLIDNELNRAKTIISVFESDMRNDGSLTHEEKKISETDVKKETQYVATPLCALNLLELLTNESGSSSALSIAKDTVRSHIKQLITLRCGMASDELVEKIMREDISPNEWRSLAAEIFMGQVMAGRKNLEEQVLDSISRAVRADIQSKNNPMNGFELRLLVIKKSLEYFREHALKNNLNDPASALDKSWTWKRITPMVDRNLSAYAKIAVMISGAGVRNLERIRHLHINPLELDAILFTGQHARYTGGTLPSRTKTTNTAGAIVMSIPDIPAVMPIIAEIDKLRKSTLQSITGREDEKYFENLNKYFSAIISRHTEPINNIFFREEERIKMMRDRKGADHSDIAAVSNEKEFHETKKAYAASIDRLNEYWKKSLEFIMLISASRRIKGEDIVGQYRYQLKRNEEYLQLCKNLIISGSLISYCDNPSIHKKFSISAGKAQGLFKFIGASLSIDKKYQTYLTKRDINTIRELKTEFIGTINSIKSDIRNSCGEYGIKRSSSEGALKKSRESLKEKIAQQEIDAQYQLARECTALHETFGYAAEVFLRYSEQYDILIKDARAGSITQPMEYAVKMNSIFSIIDIDHERIAREYATKKYLQKDGNTALARLATLLQFYKKNKIDIKDAPSFDDISALKMKFANAPHIKIDAWEMNEINFADIDKKAAKKLSLLLNIKSIYSGNGVIHEKNKTVETNNAVSIAEPELSLALPRGWEEETVGTIDTYAGIIKSFRRGNSSSCVKLVKVPLVTDDIKSLSEQWLQKAGGSLIEKRWEKTGGIEYLWILSKDKEKNITETYTLSKGGFAFMITGKTSKDQYLKFKTEFKKIINSLKLGKV